MTSKEAIKQFKERLAITDYRQQIPEYYEAIELAIEALEKQIPKKPVNYNSIPHSRCPICNNSVKVYEDAHEYHYCLYCGQCLDWEGRE